MKIGVLGTGAVGVAIATALVEKDHFVMLGSRTNDNKKSSAWVKKSGFASQGNFHDAATYGDFIFICLNGDHALAVVNSLPAEILGSETT